MAARGRTARRARRGLLRATIHREARVPLFLAEARQRLWAPMTRMVAHWAAQGACRAPRWRSPSTHAAAGADSARRGTPSAPAGRLGRVERLAHLARATGCPHRGPTLMQERALPNGSA